MTNAPLPMTRARWTVLAVGLPVALGMIALGTRAWVFGAVNSLANLNAITRSVRFSAPAGTRAVHLTVSNGDLTYHTGPGAQITGHGTLRGSLAAPSFRRQLSATGLTLSSWCRAPVGTCDASFRVTGPAGVSTDLDDSFGQLDTSGLRGDVTLSSNSGNINATDLTGTVRLNDSFGDISVTRVSGPVTMTSNSGNIAAFGVTGDVQISDSFGDVSFTGLSAADVRYTGRSGNISIVFRTVPRHVRISDSFGNVSLVLPPGSASYLVATRNQFGSTNVSVPRSPAAQNTITVSNNSGNIAIMRSAP